MTEQEWETSELPEEMLSYWRITPTLRKSLLFKVACCRRIWARLDEAWEREAVEVAERFAEGQVSQTEFLRCADLVREPLMSIEGDFALFQAITSALEIGEGPEAGWWNLQSMKNAAWATEEVVVDHEAERRTQSHLLRDLFGNPFQFVVVDPSWLTPTVVGLAEAIYDERAFDRMPMLADALEEAGCIEAAILEHCRNGGEHVRGCWVVDALLGKE